MMDFSTLKEKEPYRIIADCGNSTTKVDCFSPNGDKTRIIIPSLVSVGEDRMYQGSYLVKGYEGKNYVVGDENKTDNTNIVLSKIDLSHKLPVLTAIHQTVPNDASVELYVGLPIHSFYNTNYRKEYVAYYENEGKVALNVNNIKKTFTITKVVAMPESVGHVFNYPVDSLVGVIDIGFTTIDGAVFKDCAPISNTVFSLVDGANPFKTTVRDELNKELLLNIQPYQMDEILTKGMYGQKSEQAKEIVHRCCIDYLRKIVNEMLKHSWEIQSLPIIFTGGGSILLKDVIEEFDTFQMSQNPIFDNLDGFGEMGVLLNE